MPTTENRRGAGNGSEVQTNKRIDNVILVVIVLTIIILIVTYIATIFIQFYVFITTVEGTYPNFLDADRQYSNLMNMMTLNWNFMNVKTLMAFFSILIVLFGILVVMRTAQTVFSSLTQVPGLRTFVKTTSPGLVIVICGTALGYVSVTVEPDSFYASERKAQTPVGNVKPINSSEK